MSHTLIGKNYLLGAKVSFLIMSFIIGVVAITVKNDIWPFLQTNMPLHTDFKYWSAVAMIFGLLAPSIWLIIDWKNERIRYALLSIVIMFLLQIATEAVVARYCFISMVIPTYILYAGYRIIQYFNLQRALNSMPTQLFISQILRTLIVGISLCFWILLWIKMSFFIFPQIIYQIF